MKKHNGVREMILGLLLLAAAFLMVLYNVHEEKNAQQASFFVIEQMQSMQHAEPLLTAMPTEQETALPEETAQHSAPEQSTEIEKPEETPDSSMPQAPTETPDAPQTSQPSALPEPQTPAPAETDTDQDFLIYPDVEMPETLIGGKAYIGTLEIPKLDLRLPVMSDWDYPSLKIAPCRYYGSAYSGDLVISAHNYESHFGLLKQLMPGDTVRFTDVNGNLFAYSVANQELLQPDQVEAMRESGYELTLFTCTVGGASRVTVRCVQTGVIPAKEIGSL